jgi:hypothetical protein
MLAGVFRPTRSVRGNSVAYEMNPASWTSRRECAGRFSRHQPAVVSSSRVMVARRIINARQRGANCTADCATAATRRQVTANRGPSREEASHEAAP